MLEPVGCEMEIVIISEGYKKAGEDEKDGYTNVELEQKALDEMREAFIKKVLVMRNKYQVSG